MGSAVVWTALVAAAVNVIAGAWLGFAAWRGVNARPAWALLRLAQASCAAFALLCGVLAASGRSPSDGLFWLYVALPIAVGFVAEQLRIVSARTVLDQHGIEEAQSLRERSEAFQREIVVAIVRREAAVMAASALVSAFLLTRAAGLA